VCGATATGKAVDRLESEKAVETQYVERQMICSQCGGQTDCLGVVNRQFVCERCELHSEIHSLQSLNEQRAKELYDCIIERDKLRQEKAELVKELKDALEQNVPRIRAALARVKGE